jgi:heme oxygenase
MNLRRKISHEIPISDSGTLLYQFNEVPADFIDRKVAKIAEKKQADQEAIEEEMALEIL